MNNSKEHRKKISRIYYLSKKNHVSDYMTKKLFQREFNMKSMSQYKFLPKKTREAIDELKELGCEIKYVIN